MSELIDDAIIDMPFDMAMDGELARIQYYSTARAVWKDRENLKLEVEKLKLKAKVKKLKSKLDNSQDEIQELHMSNDLLRCNERN
jgi:cytochrome c556